MISDAIILVGGRGTRLAGFLKDRPKPLALINGEPILDLIINKLASLGIKKIILATGYQADRFESYHQKKIQDTEIICCNEPEPLGSGGGILHCSTLLNPNRPFLVLNGDTVIDSNDWGALLSPLVNEVARMGLIYQADASRYGSVSISSDNKILQFTEKKEHSSGYVNVGVVLCLPQILEIIKEYKASKKNNFISLEQEIYPKLIINKTISAAIMRGQFIDIGLPDSYATYNYSQTLQSISKQKNGEFKSRILRARFNQQKIILISKNRDALLSSYLGNVPLFHQISPVNGEIPDLGADEALILIEIDQELDRSMIDSLSKYQPVLVPSEFLNDSNLINELNEGWTNLIPSIGGVDFKQLA